MTVEEINHCSFCGKHKNSVIKLIVGHNVSICNDCVDFCGELLAKDTKKKPQDTGRRLDPRIIHQYLDQFVVGQTQAKIILSVAISNHYKRLAATDAESPINKANIFMIGPTGTGKTLMAQVVARYLDVPFVIADATTLTEAGYVGDDVDSMISRLYFAAGQDVERTQRGIVFLDEIDKIARKGESASVSRDVSGEGVQQALLKLIEGTKCRISTQGYRKGLSGDQVEIDTTNILFIVGGAFVGIDKIQKQRTQGSSMGFAAEISTDKPTGEVSPDDLVRYGMIPEFVGRFPSIISLHDLHKEHLLEILTTVKNNLITQYQQLFVQDGVELHFEQDSLDLLAERTLRYKTGARGLHTELERVLMPHMYNICEYKDQGLLRVVIDKHQVNNPNNLLRGNET